MNINFTELRNPVASISWNRCRPRREVKQLITHIRYAIGRRFHAELFTQLTNSRNAFALGMLASVVFCLLQSFTDRRAKRLIDFCLNSNEYVLAASCFPHDSHILTTCIAIIIKWTFAFDFGHCQLDNRILHKYLIHLSLNFIFAMMIDKEIRQRLCATVVTSA